MKTKIEVDHENQLLRIKIIKLEKPYLWYKDKVGHLFTAIDFRYDKYYTVIDVDSISGLPPIGYVSKDCCEIVSVLIPRKVPDFPFTVRVLKNSWFPSCWYANRIGETFSVFNGCAYGEWKVKLPDGNLGNIVKEDCEII